MKRFHVVAVCWFLLGVQAASGQEWASAMFSQRSHDFGTVPRASKAEYAFQLKNLYRDDVHIASVRASCGCATPTITKATLKSGETGTIHVRFNTGSFLGDRKATITVSIDSPKYAEVQLRITGYVRRDVVLHPNRVDFGTVRKGQTPERKISLQYAGRSNWKVLDVRSPAGSLKCEVKEIGRQMGNVRYELTVQLAERAPVGYLQEQLVLVTNDSRRPHVQLMVQGRVTSSLTVSPASLYMGSVEPGKLVTKQLVVRGSQPFHVLQILCKDDRFQFEKPSECKALHLVPITFVGGASVEEIVEEIEIETDLDGRTTKRLKAHVRVQPSGALSDQPAK